MLYYVQLWCDLHQPVSVQKRVQAPSEWQAIVQVMKHHHFHRVARAWVSRTTTESPTVRLVEVYVRGKTRSWKEEI